MELDHFLRPSLRCWIAPLAVVPLSLAMSRHHGFYSWVAISLALIALGAALLACSNWASRRTRSSPPFGTAAIVLASLLLVVQCFTRHTADNPGLPLLVGG